MQSLVRGISSSVRSSILSIEADIIPATWIPKITLYNVYAWKIPGLLRTYQVVYQPSPGVITAGFNWINALLVIYCSKLVPTI